MSYRVTFSKDRIEQASIELDKQQTGKMEIRNSKGVIFRVGENCPFEVTESIYGIRPIYGPGEIFVKGGIHNMGGKYRTSCWLYPVHGESYEVFMKTSDKEENMDIFYSVSGNVDIYELDENNLTFSIVMIPEGYKALIKFDEGAKSIRDRYKATLEKISDGEHDYILKHYMDPRVWRD